MYTKKIKIIGLIWFLLSSTAVSSQMNYHALVDNVFDIPAHKVTTGVLINRAPPLIDMKGYNGDSVAVCSPKHWLEVFYTLYHAHLDPNDFNYDLTVSRYLYDTDLQINVTPVGIIYYEYNKISPYAMEKGMLMFDAKQGKIVDISKDDETPLEIDTCFAVSPLFSSVPVGLNRFYIDPDLFVSNITGNIWSILIDFGDGRGLIPVSAGDIVDVFYSAPGKVGFYAEVIDNSATRIAKAEISVRKKVTLEDIPEVVANKLDCGEGQNIIETWYGIWYGKEQTGEYHTAIQKPVLIASGFDPENVVRIYDEKPIEDPKKDEKYLYAIANVDGFLDNLRSEGYDIIIYRSANSTKSVITNGVCLADFIQQKILDVKETDEELVVLGASMGGLTARYALTYMEKYPHRYPKGHQTRLFVSMDSPQRGANVPLGVQHLIDYLNTDIGGANGFKALNKALDSTLNTPAAQEMILYHHLFTDISGQTANCHSDRNTYLANLADIGDFPQNCITMAISMGSGTGINQGFYAGGNLIDVTPDPAMMIGLITIGVTVGVTLDALVSGLTGGLIPPGTISTAVTIAGATLQISYIGVKVNAVPNQTFSTIYDQNFGLRYCLPKIEIKFVWWGLFFGVPFVAVPTLDCDNSIPILPQRLVQVNNTVPLDNAPGSIKRWHNLKDFNAESIVKTLNFVQLTDIDEHNDCFIPSFSALDLKELDNDPHRHIINYLDERQGVTKISDYFYCNTAPAVSHFDYLYIEEYNNFHIYDTVGNGVMTPNMLAAIYSLISNKELCSRSGIVVRDDSQDDGTEPNPRPVTWNSPDIWLTADPANPVPIPNSQLSNYDDCYIAVKIKNIDNKPTKGTEKLHVYWSKAGTNSTWESSWTAHWTPHWFNLLFPAKGGEITNPQGFSLPVLQPNGETTVYIPWNLPDNEAYHGVVRSFFKSTLKMNWGFSLLAKVDDGLELNSPLLLSSTFAQNFRNVAVDNGSLLLFSRDYSNLLIFEPVLNQYFKFTYKQLLKADKYKLNDFAEVYAVLSDDLIEKLNQEQSKGIKMVDENRVFLTSDSSELVFYPLDKEEGAYFIGAEVNFISDKMPELNDFNFDLIFKVEDKELETMRYTAIRDADVYFKAQAEASKKKVVKAKEEVTLTSNIIYEDATYTWYNEAEEVIGKEYQITIIPDYSQKYKIEIKQDKDGFKAYDEVEVIVVDGVIKSLAPNPAQDYIRVDYLLSDNAPNASIQISNIQNTISVSFPLLTTETYKDISLPGLVSGNYIVKLIIDGAVVDGQTLIIK